MPKNISVICVFVGKFFQMARVAVISKWKRKCGLESWRRRNVSNVHL